MSFPGCLERLGAFALVCAHTRINCSFIVVISRVGKASGVGNNVIDSSSESGKSSHDEHGKTEAEG